MLNKTPKKLPEETASAPKPSNSNKNLLFVLFIFLILVIGIFLILVKTPVGGDTITAPAGRISIETANSHSERAKGLSGRESISENSGLLFVFEESATRNCFWMKDMKFSIDMVWMNDNQEVVTVIPNVSPETYPDNFCPSEPAKYGLELSSGSANRLQIVEGTKLR